MQNTVTVSIALRVYDEQQFRGLAVNRAIQDGIEEKEAQQYQNPEEKSLAECAQMLIDPGVSPLGSEILESSAA
jgi:hypothetical protein